MHVLRCEAWQRLSWCNVEFANRWHFLHPVQMFGHVPNMARKSARYHNLAHTRKVSQTAICTQTGQQQLRNILRRAGGICFGVGYLQRSSKHHRSDIQLHASGRMTISKYTYRLLLKSFPVLLLPLHKDCQLVRSLPEHDNGGCAHKCMWPSAR